MAWSWFFVLCSIGWVFYQAFEAYHTAKARRDGLPLPDPFGLNNIRTRWEHPVRSAIRERRRTLTPTGADIRLRRVERPPPLGQVYPRQQRGKCYAGCSYAQSSPYTAPPPPPPVWDDLDSSASSGQQSGNGQIRPAIRLQRPCMRYHLRGRSTVPAAAAWLIGLGVVFMLFNHHAQVAVQHSQGVSIPP